MKPQFSNAFPSWSAMHLPVTNVHLVDLLPTEDIGVLGSDLSSEILLVF